MSELSVNCEPFEEADPDGAGLSEAGGFCFMTLRRC